MSSIARNRLLRKPPESVSRAQKLNQLEERMLSAKINTFSREEKQLRKEIAGLRKSRSFLQETIEPMLVSRPRSFTEPRVSKASWAEAAQKATDSEKLPQLVSLQSPPPRRRAYSNLAVPEASGPSPLSKSCEELRAFEKAEDRCVVEKFKSLTPTPRRKSTLCHRSLERVKSLDLDDSPSAQTSGRKVGIGGKPIVRRRANSDVTHLANHVVPEIVCEDANNEPFTNGRANKRVSLGIMTPPVLSPILGRRGAASPAMKTNRDFMEESHMISTFNVVGQRSLGAAILRHRASMETDELRVAISEEPTSRAERIGSARVKGVGRGKGEGGREEAEAARRVTLAAWERYGEMTAGDGEDAETRNNEEDKNDGGGSSNKNNSNSGSGKDNNPSNNINGKISNNKDIHRNANGIINNSTSSISNNSTSSISNNGQ